MVRFPEEKPFFSLKTQVGIGLLHTKSHSLAIKIKDFQTHKDEANKETWIIVTRYPLAKKLYHLHKYSSVRF